MVGVGNSSLQAAQQTKLVGLFWGLVATCYYICNYYVNEVNSHSAYAMMTAPWTLSLSISIIIAEPSLASVGISCCRVSVRRSFVTSRCSTETAKRRITQTMLHDSPGTLLVWCQKSRQNSNGFTPNRGTKCRWGRLNAGAVAANWQLLTRSIVSLARLQVYHTEHPLYLFAARSLWCSALHGFVNDSWSLLEYLMGFVMWICVTLGCNVLC